MAKEASTYLDRKIEVRVVADIAHKPTLRLSFRAGVPINPELWVNQTVANDPAALQKYLEWARLQLKSNERSEDE